MRTILIIALAALTPSAAAAGPTGLTAGEIAMQALPDPYPVVYTPNAEYQDFNGRMWRQDYIRRLNQLCRSRREGDRQTCESVWKIINTSYADLQAKRAAEAAD